MVVYSLSPSMRRRLNFEHDLLDNAEKVEFDECTPENFVTGNLWLVKDYVMRFRAHYPESRKFTEDMVSAGIEALVEFGALKDGDFDALSNYIHEGIRSCLNDLRSIVRATTITNRRRQRDGAPLEYHYAQHIREELCGIIDDGPEWVDLLDSIQSVTDADKEDIFETVLGYLEERHGIPPESLSKKEKDGILELLEIFR